MHGARLLLAMLFFGLCLGAAPRADAKGGWQRLVVTATAYNSLRRQTDGTPNHGAWGDRIDRLGPGVHAIAVSRDLLRQGLRRNQRIRIKGHPGEYVVLDSMHGRWRKRIDIHMGKDLRKARKFGRRKVEISWQPSGKKQSLRTLRSKTHAAKAQTHKRVAKQHARKARKIQSKKPRVAPKAKAKSKAKAKAKSSVKKKSRSARKSKP